MKCTLGPIEAVFDGFRERQNGASWWYGNVLDRKDQALGWWKEPGRGLAAR
ncbi:MAG TPA: hypothetical protein VFI25_17025 [Planctomycetota bacterium]|nr:hypothetical protein [Planctomycetota bacterium]